MIKCRHLPKLFMILFFTAFPALADAPIHRGKSVVMGEEARLFFPNDTISMRHGGAQHLIIESANNTGANLANYTITLTLPTGYEIIDPSGRTFVSHFGINMPNLSFQTINSRQVVTMSFANPIAPGDIDDNQYYYATLLVMRALSNAEVSGTLNYSYTADGMYRSVSITSTNVVYDKWVECTYILDELNAYPPDTANYNQWTEYNYTLYDLNTYPPDNNQVTLWVFSDNHATGSSITSYVDHLTIVPE